MIPFADGVVEPTLWFLADWSLRWAVLIGILAAWLLVFRPRRAATRYVTCCAVLLAGLSIPVLPRWGPGIQLSAPIPSAPVEPVTDVRLQSPRSEPIEPTLPDAITTPTPTVVVTPEPARPVVAAAQPTPDPIGTRQVVVLSIAALWLGGIGVYLVRWAAGCWFLLRIRRTATTLSGRPAEIFAACRTELRSKRQIAFACHPNSHSPLSLGMLRPLVLVPANWAEEPEHVQRSSLLHEIAHLARYDDWMAMLMELVRAVFWFHPLVRWLLACIERDRELLCDEAALGHGIDPREYAQVLLQFARRPSRLLPAGANMPSYPLRFGRRRTVKVRIEHLLEENMHRWIGPLSRRRAMALATVVIGVAVGLGCARIQSQPEVVEDEKPTNQAQTTAAENKSQAERARSYLIQPFDVLRITLAADGLLERFQLEGHYLVQPDGLVWLGGMYGGVKIGGMTVAQAQTAVEKQVVKRVDNPGLTLQFAGRVTKWLDDSDRKHPYRIQPGHTLAIRLGNKDVLQRFRIDEQHVVDASGRVDLGEFYGKVKLGGLTLEEANKAVVDVAGKVLDNAQIDVGLGGWERDWQRLELADDPNANAPQVPKIPREDLKYDGKHFDDWRRDLLTELKPEVRVAGIKAMAEFGAHGYGTEAAEVILEIMRGIELGFGDLSPNNVLPACGSAMRRIGPVAVPVLLKGLKDPKPTARLFAASSLMYVEPTQTDALPALVEVIKDDNIDVRLAAIQTGSLLDKDGTMFLPPLIDALNGKNEYVRNRAIQIVSHNHRLASKVEAAVPAIADALKTKHVETCASALSVLSALGPKANEAVPALVASSNSPFLQLPDVISATRKLEPDNTKFALALAGIAKANPHSYVSVAAELRNLGPDSKTAIELLTEMLKSSDERQIVSAVHVLAGLGPLAKDALPELAALQERTSSSAVYKLVPGAVEKISR